MADLTPTQPVIVERRAEPTSLVLLMQQIHDNQVLMMDRHALADAKQDAFDKKLTRHMTDETSELAQEITRLMTAAFPDGDPDGHRRHHEAIIVAAEERAAFWKKMREEIGKWGILGVMGFIVIATWAKFVRGPGG